MPLLGGVDGCSNGWVVATQNTDTGLLKCLVVDSLASLLATGPIPAVLAIDVPIGLPESGPRACDAAARARLGARRSSVFPAPQRPGAAVANSLAAVVNGARQVECTINGIGERAGNASLEEIVMILKTRKDVLGLETSINTEQIYPSSRLVSGITGIMVQPNKAIVGDNAFAHESGIHQDGLLKDKSTHEIMKPESVGISRSTLVMGKHSGRHAFKTRLSELGYELAGENLDKAFERFKKLADKKKEVFDEDIQAIVQDEVLRLEMPDKYRLLRLNITSGTDTAPSAQVEMEVDGKAVKDKGTGDGPVDSSYNVIAKITGTKSRLLKYSVNAITGGTDAQGEVTVSLQEGESIVLGQGSHTDIIVASAKAYINALNRLEYRKKDRRECLSL